MDRMNFYVLYPTDTIVVDRWAKKATFSEELLAQTSYIWTDGKVIKITVSNGTATYRVLEHDDENRLVHAELVNGLVKP